MSAIHSVLSLPRDVYPPYVRYDRCALRMVQRLMAELLHEEESNLRRAERDAARYDGVELSAPFRAIVVHAGATIPCLSGVAAARKLERRTTPRLVGRWIGHAVDLYRERFTTSERAYRVTISRIRHGIDLVRLLRSAADGADDVDLVRFCDEWLLLRRALVESLTEQLDWFGDRPRVSMETAHCIAGARENMAICRRVASHCGGTPQMTGYDRLLQGPFAGLEVSASNLQ